MNTKIASYFCRAASIAILGCAIAPRSQASSFVVPNGNQTVDGDYNNLAPFSNGLFGFGPTERYEQVYAASQFGAPGSTLDIGSIAFRLDGIDAADFFSDTYPSVEIDLSTTPFGPNQLSSSFASNIGPDDQIVYNGSLTLSGSGGQSPNPFNLIINLQSPFQYSNSNGNLLLDIRFNAPGNGFMPALDATSASPYTSRLRSFNDVNSPTGTADTVGLVTQFNPTPEPSALTLCVCGMALLGLRQIFLRIPRRGAEHSVPAHD